MHWIAPSEKDTASATLEKRLWDTDIRHGSQVKIAAAEHGKLRNYGICVWKQGTIEDALGVSDKGEEAIQAIEQGLAAMKKADVKASYPSVAEFLDWLTT